MSAAPSIKALEALFEDPAHRDVPAKARIPVTRAIESLFDDLIDLLAPKTIVEVGAFEAAFALRAKARHPGAEVIALEANPRVHAHFTGRLKDSGVDYRHLAAGANAGEATIHIPEMIANTAMPHVGRMGSLHVVALRDSRTVTATVPMLPLDRIAPRARAPIALWIDVEGAVAEVLDGAAETLAATDLLICELESSPVWEGQTLDRAVRERLEQAGFILVARDCQKWFQYNAIFARPTLLDKERVAARIAAYRDEAVDSWSGIVPPSLFQYWDRDGRPEEVDSLMRGWANDPAFSYRAFTRSSAIDTIHAHLGRRVADVFARCRAPAMQADLFRLCMLHAFGGIYVDADIANLGRNETLLERGGRGYLFHRRGNLANDVMVVHRPEDPLMAFALEQAMENIEQGRGANVWQMTGPGILTAAYNRLGPDDPLFRGFRFGKVEDLRQHVGFRWDLPYKELDTDWRNMAARDLIAPAGAP